MLRGAANHKLLLGTALNTFLLDRCPNGDATHDPYKLRFFLCAVPKQSINSSAPLVLCAAL